MKTEEATKLHCLGSVIENNLDWADIKLLVLDCDGVLTHGCVYVDGAGNESARFSHRDGMGVELLRRAYVRVIVLTNQESDYPRQRCKKMDILCLRGTGNKQERLSEWLRLNPTQYKLEEICYVGDDVNDITTMRFVGLPVAVGDAEESVKSVAKYITSRNGGNGAVREVCDLILKAKGVLP